MQQVPRPPGSSPRTSNDYLGEGGANETIGTAAGDIDFFGWSTASTNYGISTSTKNANYSGDFVDWGTAIDDKGTWRTLRNDEWTYLFNKHSKKWASVNDVNGYVIAPDGFTGTLSDSYTDDAALAADNLVFLPATGYRSGSGVSSVGIFGYYWSSSVLVYNNSYCVNFDSLGVSPSSGDHCDDGISVRLVTASK